MASLVFGKNCRKIGVNTSRPESKKWWHHNDIRHMLQSESSTCGWGELSQHHEYLLKTLLWHHQFFISPRLFLTAPSNSEARQVRWWIYQEISYAGGGDVDAAVDEDLLQVGAAVCEREEAVVGESVQSREDDPPQGAAPGDLRHTHIRHLRHTKQFKLNVTRRSTKL